ncbi:F-box domain protein, partial [Opisthorchis viverrini]
MDAFSNYSITNGGVISNGKPTAYQKCDVCINEKLPKELIIKIFSYLDMTTLCKCSQVCKPKVIEKIAQRSRGFLRELFLKGCQNVTDDAI